MTTGEQLLQIIQSDETLSYYADSFTHRAKDSAKQLPPVAPASDAAPDDEAPKEHD